MRIACVLEKSLREAGEDKAELERLLGNEIQRSEKLGEEVDRLNREVD
jgi:hypothetical protein